MKLRISLAVAAASVLLLFLLVAAAPLSPVGPAHLLLCAALAGLSAALYYGAESQDGASQTWTRAAALATVHSVTDLSTGECVKYSVQRVARDRRGRVRCTAKL